MVGVGVPLHRLDTHANLPGQRRRRLAPPTRSARATRPDAIPDKVCACGCAPAVARRRFRAPNTEALVGTLVARGAVLWRER